MYRCLSLTVAVLFTSLANVVAQPSLDAKVSELEARLATLESQTSTTGSRIEATWRPGLYL